ncbi:BON domain-containing protein [Paracandidimonas lactea]|uniref:BON domain-containing protein n=1 Tax=Paracandidimonas lactea TaxID=2895524 RepID=UPI001F3F33DC|nr:BON domain-containing protein [Paracandidimonas lactea]
MTKHRFSRVMMTAAVTTLLAACAQQPARQSSAAGPVDDTTINTKVQNAVLGVRGVHEKDIQVSTTDGVVKLRGSVDNQMAAQDAIQAARQVEGVKKVDYDLDVKSTY